MNKSAACRIGAARQFFGADERSRTPDLLITNQLLYQLSYISRKRDYTGGTPCKQSGGLRTNADDNVDPLGGNSRRKRRKAGDVEL